MAKKPAKLGRLRSTTKLGQKKCARNSLRAVMPNGRPDVRIIVCCPPGKWKDAKGRRKAKCSVPLRGHLKKKYTKRKR